MRARLNYIPKTSKKIKQTKKTPTTSNNFQGCLYNCVEWLYDFLQDLVQFRFKTHKFAAVGLAIKCLVFYLTDKMTVVEEFYSKCLTEKWHSCNHNSLQIFIFSQFHICMYLKYDQYKALKYGVLWGKKTYLIWYLQSFCKFMSLRKNKTKK